MDGDVANFRFRIGGMQVFRGDFLGTGAGGGQREPSALCGNDLYLVVAADGSANLDYSTAGSGVWSTVVVIAVDERLGEGKFLPELVAERVLPDAATAGIADHKPDDGRTAILTGICDVQL